MSQVQEHIKNDIQNRVLRGEKEGNSYANIIKADKSNACKEFRMTGKCKQGANCPYKHSRISNTDYFFIYKFFLFQTYNIFIFFNLCFFFTCH